MFLTSKRLSYVVIIFCALLGVIHCSPLFGPAATILRYDNILDPFGGFAYNVDTSDGIHEEAEGVQKNAGTAEETLVVKGKYSYVGDDGKTYTVEYIADENGYQPAGEHLPPSAGVKKLGVPSAALASLAGGGLG